MTLTPQTLAPRPPKVRPVHLAEQPPETIFERLALADVVLPPPVVPTAEREPLAPPVPARVIEAELAALPEAQCLHRYRQFRVYGARCEQIEHTMREIARQRELTFRGHQEGSGRADDSNAFDQTYEQIFVWDTEARALVGGYRAGRSDRLLERYGAAGLYLASMFDFEAEFFAGAPALEVGRSFVVPAYQKSYMALFLLWCGIGRYLVRHPQYRRLYGVVSISRTYSPTSIAIIRDALLEPAAGVHARLPFAPDLGPAWREFLACHGPLPMDLITRLVATLEPDGRGVPVLIRHYHKLGARFVEAAVDASFNNTPGLLLTLDMMRIAPKFLDMYLGEGKDSYLAAAS